jgi:hypothetical protein
MTEEINNDDIKISTINVNIYKPNISKTPTATQTNASANATASANASANANAKNTWTIISNNGKLNEKNNPICNITTVRIGSPPSQKKLSLLPLSLGEENAVVRQWETYYNETINNPEFSLFTNAALILLQMQTIHKEDLQQKTMNFHKIMDKYLPLIEALVKISNF